MNSNYYIKVILKRKFLILAISLISGVATYLLINQKNKEYISKAQLATGITNNQEVSVTQVETNWNIINNRFNNFIEFMNSKEIYSLLMYKLVLHDLNSPTPFRPLETKKIKSHFSGNQLTEVTRFLQFKYDSMQVLFLDNTKEANLFELIKDMYYDPKTIKKNLTFSRIPNTDFIKLECKSENPNLSAFIVNSYTDETIRFFKHREMMRLGSSVTFFEELVKTKKAILDSKVNYLENFKNTSQLIDYKIQSQSKLDQIAALEQAKNDETRKISSLENAIKQINSQIGKGVKSFDSKNLDGDIVELQRKISSLNKYYVNSGMQNVKTADSLRMLKEKLDMEIGKFSRESFNGDDDAKKELLTKKLNYEIELSMAQPSLNYINNTLNSIKADISNLAVNETTISELEMAVNVAREDYLSMLGKYNTAKNVSLANTEDLKQIEFGQPADEPEPSKKMLFTASSAIASLVLVITSIILLVYFDNSIKTPEMLSRVTGLNVLGHLSQLKIKKLDLKTIFFSEKPNKNISDFKEQLRKIRFEIENSGGKIILVTSTKLAEGKSLVLFSLAYSLSLNSKKILIIDTNFKHNTLTNMYNGDDTIEKLMLGDRNLLTLKGNHSEENSFEKEQTNNNKYISNTDIKGVDILGCKGNEFSPSELFLSKNFNEMLSSLTNVYDFILMEGAALNSYSDTRELSQYADKMIAVFSAKSVIKQVDMPSISFIANNNKFLGAILNNVDAENLEL